MTFGSLQDCGLDVLQVKAISAYRPFYIHQECTCVCFRIGPFSCVIASCDHGGKDVLGFFMVDIVREMVGSKGYRVFGPSARNTL